MQCLRPSVHCFGFVPAADGQTQQQAREHTLNLHFYFKVILGAFCLYSDRTAEDTTGKGAEREGMTCSK